MSVALKYSIIFISLIVVMLVALFFIVSFLKKKRKNNMYIAINQLFNEYIKNNPDCTFEEVSKAEYDYKFETPKYI